MSAFDSKTFNMLQIHAWLSKLWSLQRVALEFVSGTTYEFKCKPLGAS